MRARALAVAVASIFAVVSAGAFRLDTFSTESNTPVVAACTVQGPGCSQPSLDGGGQFVISHQVLRGGCSTADLHVMRYFSPAIGVSPLVVTWCGWSKTSCPESAWFCLSGWR